MNGQGGTASLKGYITDWGFWGAVVIVSVGVSLLLHLVGVPGSRR